MILKTYYLKMLLIIVFSYGVSSQIMGIHPNIGYLKDRKWDLRQIYIGDKPVDSLEVVKMKMSMIFSTELNYCYQINYVDTIYNFASIKFLYQVYDQANNTNIKVYNVNDINKIAYTFTIAFLQTNHMVLTFKQIDAQNPSITHNIEYRFVADNSVHYDNSGNNTRLAAPEE